VELGRRGRKRQLPVEDEYWGLILDGVGTVEACRQVGIGRKTGYRWRAERGGLPPLRMGEADRASRYLSQLERQRIATLRGRGLGVREIACRLRRSPSTVSRELRRNVRPHDAGVYDGDLAHARARERGRRNRAGCLSTDGQLRQVVQDKLELEWSPEDVKGQVRGTLHRYRSVTQEVARACADLTEATRGRRRGCVPTWAAMTGRRPG
jgi:transposase